MANRWGIPPEVESFVKQRDSACVYCGVEFSTAEKSRKNKASWEHIVNDVRLSGVNNIALCCISCNASKGAKLLEDWLGSSYCKAKGIDSDSVAEVVKDAIITPLSIDD